MRIKTIIVFGLITACGPTHKSNIEMTLENFANYLPGGTHPVELVELTRPPRASGLFRKFDDAMKTNWNWFVAEADKATASGQSIPYDERMGLTKDEYEEFLKIQNSGGYEYVKTGNETVTINYSNGKITFQSKGELDMLNTVTINPNDLSVAVGEYRLGEIDTVEVTKDNNAFNSSWKGYKWHNITNHYDKKTFSLTIGKLKRTNKTFFGLIILEGPIDRKFEFFL